MGEAVRIDGKMLEINQLLAKSTLERNACLTLVQDDWLIVDQRPAICDMGVGANGMAAPPGFTLELCSISNIER